MSDSTLLSKSELEVVSQNCDPWHVHGDVGFHSVPKDIDEFIETLKSKLPNVELPIDIGFTGYPFLTVDVNQCPKEGWCIDKAKRFTAIMNEHLMFQRYTAGGPIMYGKLGTSAGSEMTADIRNEFLTKFIMATCKVVSNNCYGGFGLSKDAIALYNKKRINAQLSPVKHPYIIPRTDPHLIEVVEELKEAANTTTSRLVIEEIPIEYKDCYELIEYDGLESISCDSADLIFQTLRSLNLDNMNTEECSTMLKKLVNLAKS